MELSYRTYGAGAPLIILHGLFGSSDNWHSMSRCWAANFQVFAIDQRNHGESPHMPGMNYNLLSLDLATFMDEHVAEPAFVVGHSMGGKVAMTFADQYPERVRALAVLDIGIKAYEARHRDILDCLRHLDLTDFQRRRELDTALSDHIQSAAVRQFLIKNVRRLDEGGFAWKFNHEAILVDYPKLVAEIPMQYPFEGPTLFLRGQYSDYIQDRDWPTLQNFFPDSELNTLEDCGHWLHAERPDEVCDIVGKSFKARL